MQPLHGLFAIAKLLVISPGNDIRFGLRSWFGRLYWCKKDKVKQIEIATTILLEPGKISRVNHLDRVNHVQQYARYDR